MKYIEVLATGVTVQGGVRVAGECVEVRDDFPIESKKDQAARWGAPRYKTISKGEYETRTGKVAVDSPPPVTKTSLAAGGEPPADIAAAEAAAAEADAGDDGTGDETPPAGGDDDSTPDPSIEDEFAELAEEDDEALLLAASQMDEETLTRFTAYIQAVEGREAVAAALEG